MTETMEMSERCLRRLLGWPHGPSCGQAILQGVAEGKPLSLTMEDGNELALTDVTHARMLLEDLGWKTS